MVAKNRSLVDSLYPAFQLFCFLFVGFMLCTFGLPVLQHVLGDEFVHYLSNINQLP